MTENVRALAAAAFKLLVSCEVADANEDLSEYVDMAQMAAVRAALLECSACGGHGTIDGLPHEDEPRDPPCPKCSGWGVLPEVGVETGYKDAPESRLDTLPGS